MKKETKTTIDSTTFETKNNGKITTMMIINMLWKTFCSDINCDINDTNDISYSGDSISRFLYHSMYKNKSDFHCNGKEASVPIDNSNINSTQNQTSTKTKTTPGNPVFTAELNSYLFQIFG